MLKRAVRIQLMVFVVATAIGVSYVGAKYAGLFRGVFANECTVHADFAESGGIFTGAEVTYRGVGVGRVGDVRLTDGGVRVDLVLDDCADPAIPETASATVANRSVIGEQYVNLVPPSGEGPFLAEGSVIPASRNSLPIPAGTLLTDVNDFVTTIDTGALGVTLDELSQAFGGQALALGQLIDASSALIGEADENLPQTLDLIDTAGGVLNTQLEEAGALEAFSSDLRLLAGQLRASDPDLRRLVDETPRDLQVLQDFVVENRTDFGLLLANLSVTGDLLVRHKAGIRQVLILYPLLPAGAKSVIGTDGVSEVALVPNFDDPPICGDAQTGSQGYQSTTRRPPSDTSPAAPNTSAYCSASPSSGVSVRGSQNVPGGDPR